MKTYSLVEKNGNASITISAENEEEIEEWSKEQLKERDNWRLEFEEDE